MGGGCRVAGVRLALALCLLALAAPAAALANEPVISYVHANGDGTFTLRLYDEQSETEVTPPPVPAFAPPQFRYGISMNGRYIVFNDADKKLHLLDRATNSQIPLPGIDVYTADGPGSLTVSDAGLIAFDKNGNGPALVYNSATGQFVDAGLAANNGHRQTHLSADGHFLGTTCNDDNCEDNLDMGADPYVQDLGTKLDTGFPNDATFDEEHPCIDGDGSVFGFDKGAIKDVFLFDRSQSPPAAISVPGMNDPLKNETNCVLDAEGQYVGFFDGTAFQVYYRGSGTFLMLDPGKEFDTTSLFSAPYSPPQPPGGGGGNPGGGQQPPPPGDAKPVAAKFRMTHRRFRVRRRATAFRFTLSEPAAVRLVIRRVGRRVGTIRRSGLDAGANRIAFNGKLGGRKLRPGEYAAVLIATDSAGNRSLPVFVEFRVLRPAGVRRR
jgi:hypothetical protein